MELRLSDDERADLERGMRETRRVREWKRYRTILLGAEGRGLGTIAETLGISETSVSNWIRAWRERGRTGLAEGVHPGLARRFDAAGEAWLDGLLRTDPPERGYALTGWTVPALRTEASKAGYVVSESTMRRAIWRLGWRWKRPKFVLGRPDPEYTQKKTGS